MSVVVAVKDPDHDCVYMAADSSISSPSVILHMRTSKMVRRGDWLFGVSGDWHVNEALEYMDDKLFQRAQDVRRQLVLDIVPALRGAIKAYEHVCDDEGHSKPCICSEVLVAYDGQIFMIQSTLTVIDCADLFMASGSGEFYALGALSVADEFVALSSERATRAVGAAIKYSPSCDGHIMVERTRTFHERECQPTS